MCLLFFYINNDAGEGSYQLILVNQRDEMYNRPSKPAAFWDSAKHCISGFDLTPGAGQGTWFGVSTHGKVGTLLNILRGNPIPNGKRSRGGLVKNYLTSNIEATEYLGDIAKEADVYNPFNLVLMELRQLKWEVHYVSSPEKEVRTVTEGCHGFGNSVRGAPFTKVCNGVPHFQAIVEENNSTSKRDVLCEKLLHMMTNKDTIHLPDAEMSRLGGNWLEGKYLSELARWFVYMPDREYGSRTTTVVLVDNEGNCEYIEKTLQEPIDKNDFHWNTEAHKFKMDPEHAFSSL